MKFNKEIDETDYLAMREATKRVLDICQNGNLKEEISKSKNLNNMIYTMLHIKAFDSVKTEIVNQGISIGDVGFYHDYDKLVYYMVMSKKEASSLHRRTTRHHDRKTMDRNSLLEMVIDWECAHLTKIDKPLSACDTLHTLYMDMDAAEEIELILKELHLDNKHYNGITEEEFQKMLGTITVDDIASKIIDALHVMCCI